MSTYRTAIIGPTDVISGFRALGVDAYPATTGTAMLETLLRLKRASTEDVVASEDKYAVVIVIESLVAEVPSEEWEKMAGGVLPAVVVLPGVEGTSGQGVRSLRRLAERAVGSDILQ